MNDSRKQNPWIGTWLPRLWVIALLAGWLATTSNVRADDEGESDAGGLSLNWVEGPSTGAMQGVAEISVPEGYRFVGPDDTRILMEAMGNLVNGTEVGFICPDPNPDKWFVVFEYDETGYVKDDEKNDLDADAMLKAIKKGNEYGNKERAKRGLPAMHIVGWEQPPRYDEATQNLVWAPLIESDGEPFVNYNTRRLGRSGVMSVTLVCDTDKLPKIVPEFNTLMQDFNYVSGQKYSEFRSGDKIAEYGLTALVTGGAVAVAAKSGLLKYLWKLIVVGVAAVGAFLKKIFGGGKSTTT